MQYIRTFKKFLKLRPLKDGKLRPSYKFWCLRVYQVDALHSHSLGQDASLQSIAVVVMATRPVFGTFSESSKTKMPKGWTTKTLLYFCCLRVYQVYTWHSRCLGQDISLQSIVVVAMATRPVFSTFQNVGTLRSPRTEKLRPCYNFAV